MKKIFICIALYAAAFFSPKMYALDFGASLEFNSDIFNTTSFIDNYADTAHVFYQGSDILRMFFTNKLKAELDANAGEEGKLRWSGHIQFKVDNLAQGLNSGGDNSTPSWNFGDWQNTLEWGAFSAYIGNMADYGTVKRISKVFDEFGTRGMNINSSLGEDVWSLKDDGYGILKGEVLNKEYDGKHPYTRDMSLTAIEVNNLATKADGSAAKFVIGAALDFSRPQAQTRPQTRPQSRGLFPLAIYFAAPDVFISQGHEIENNEKITDVNFNLRLEAPHVKDVFSIAAVYKQSKKKYDYDTDKNINNYSDIIHSFGVYSDVNIKKVFNIGMGFSALTQTYTPPKEHTITKIYPWHYGIDLRASITGIPKLVVDINIHTSFSKIEGDDDKSKEIYGVLNTTLDLATRNNSEKYYGLYIGAAAAYKILNNLTIKAQFSSQTAKATTVNDAAKTNIYNGNSFGAFAGVDITLSRFISMRSGFALRSVKFSYDRAVDDDSAGYGVVQYSIPLAVKIKY
jgi:hypothetical protein